MNKDLMVIFPGQGSQFLSMGKFLFDNFDNAKKVFLAVNEALEFDLSGVIFGNDEKILRNTENAQPAIMCVSVALFRVACDIFGDFLNKKILFAAGHSLGEYSALCCSNSIDIASAAKLLKIRGASMNKAYNSNDGAMFAIIGLECEQIRKIIFDFNESENCYIANDNGASQIVISGHLSSLIKIADICKKNGAKLAKKLDVSIPFHSPFMKEAEKAMLESIKSFEFYEPRFSIISNVTAKPFSSNPKEIKDLLVRQITCGVRWRESIEFALSSGVKDFIEIGPGCVLTNLIRRMTMGDDCIRCSNLYEKLSNCYSLDFSSVFA